MVNTAKPHKYAHVEHERCFLLAELPAGLDLESGFNRITDTYLTGARLRLRRVASPDGNLLVAKFTQKFKEPDQKPYQTTITNLYLNDAEFALLSDLGGLQISKRRYAHQYDGMHHSIDVFEDRLDGLMLCDVEANSKPEIKSRPVPAFALREVTGDPAFTGGELAKLSRVEFERFFETIFENA